MTADGRIDMMDIMGMLGGGELDLTPPKFCGRIVTGFNGLILGLETKSIGLEDNMVYDIQTKNGVLTLNKQGKSHIDFNSSYKDISSLLLTEKQRLILTETEKYSLELEDEIELSGFLKTRDAYLVKSTKSDIAKEKLKILRVMYPASKYPEKWV